MRGRAGQRSALGLALFLAAAIAAPAPARRLSAGSGPAEEPRGEPARAERCCFVNTAYSGVCEVQPAQDETCATILAYLNQPGSTGKAYCNNTTTRGGWTQVQCERGSEPSSRN